MSIGPLTTSNYDSCDLPISECSPSMCPSGFGWDASPCESLFPRSGARMSAPLLNRRTRGSEDNVAQRRADYAARRQQKAKRLHMARLFNKKPIQPLLYKGMVERTFHLKNEGIEPIKTLSCLIARIGKLATIILIIFLRYTL